MSDPTPNHPSAGHPSASHPSAGLPGTTRAPALSIVAPLPRFEPEPDLPGARLPDPRTTRLRVVPDDAGPTCGARRSPTHPAPPTVPADPVDPAAVVAAQLVLRTALEVLDRRRPTTHLAGVLVPALQQRVVATMAAGRPAAASPTRLHRVHVQQAGPRAAEVFGRVERAGRHRAVAARIELRAGRWVATALRFG